MKIYIDGELKNEKNVSEDIVYNKGRGTNIFRIGGYSYGTVGSPLLIDYLQFYNAALSSSQIKQNYIAGLNSMLANGNISKQEYNERINALAYDN